MFVKGVPAAKVEVQVEPVACKQIGTVKTPCFKAAVGTEDTKTGYLTSLLSSSEKKKNVFLDLVNIGSFGPCSPKLKK